MGELDPGEAHIELAELKASRKTLEDMLPNFAAAFKGVKGKRRSELEDIRRASGEDWRAGDIIPGVSKMSSEDFARAWGQTTHAAVSLDGEPFTELKPLDDKHVEALRNISDPRRYHVGNALFFRTTLNCTKVSPRRTTCRRIGMKPCLAEII